MNIALEEMIRHWTPSSCGPSLMHFNILFPPLFPWYMRHPAGSDEINVGDINFVIEYHGYVISVGSFLGTLVLGSGGTE